MTLNLKITIYYLTLTVMSGMKGYDWLPKSPLSDDSVNSGVSSSVQVGVPEAVRSVAGGDLGPRPCPRPELTPDVVLEEATLKLERNVRVST